ncbi:MAG: tRNA pseudouridine synthase A, partial [Anaerovoracaceae bacterium]
MERTILLTIEYDGTDFFGWQRQPNVPTVQGEVEKALSIICGKPIKINGTSRTDGGVHAFGQRASFSGEFGIPTERIKFAVNNILPGAIRIGAVEEKEAGFHARFNAVGKKYCYKIMNTEEKSPFGRNLYYYVKKPLNLDLMRLAAAEIVGTHDFKCFEASGGEERETTVRTVHSL